MKRFFALVALVLGLASCQTEPEGLDVQMGGAVDATITVNIPDSETRAGGTKSAGSIFDNVNLGTENDTNTMRYILMIYDANGVASKDRQVTYSDGKTVNFDVRLVPGRHYSFVVWADYVTSKDDTDNHYNTTDLTNITLNDTWVAMDETRDAFTGVFNTKVDGNKTEYNGAKDIDITLTRPFAKLRVITTDIKELDDLHIAPYKAVATYTTKHYESFNALNSTYTGEVANVEHTYDIASYDDNVTTGEKQTKVLFTDYFFANNEVVNFTLDVKEQNGTSIKFNTFNTAIPAQRNYLTTISGNILTDGNKVNVTIEDAFENVDDNGNTTNPDYDYETISSVSEFYAAVNKLENGEGNEYNYIVVSDLNIDTTPIASLAATRSTTDNKKVTINLNGKTITVKNEGTAPFITLDDDQTLVLAGAGNIIMTAESTASFIDNNNTNGGVIIEQATVTNNSTSTNAKVVEGMVIVTGDADIEEDAVEEDAIVSGIDALVNICANGGEFTFTEDLTADEVILVSTTNPVVINGNNKTLNTSANRAIRVTPSNADLTINGLNIVSSAVMIYPSDVRGVSIDPDLSNVQLTLNDCTIDFTDETTNDWTYAVNVSGNGTGHKVTVNGGTYEGANVVNVHGAKNTIVVKNATLNSLYPATANYIASNYYGACIYVSQHEESSVYAEGNTFFGDNAMALNIGYTPCKEENNYHNTKFYYKGMSYVSSADALQRALNNDDTNIVLYYDIVGDVTVIQKPNVQITIDGDRHKFNGYFKVHSNSEHYADAAVTFKNINFETAEVLYNEKSEPYFNFIEALDNGNGKRYSTNITAENCTFTATGEAKDKAVAVGLQIKSSKWAKAINCTATDLHSLVQAQSCDTTVEVIGCTIYGKNGVAFKQVKEAKVENTTIVAREYGIRFDGNTDNYGIVVKNNTITAAQPFIVRKMTGANNTIALEGENTLKSTREAYQIVITNGSDDAAYVIPTGTYIITGADKFCVFPMVAIVTTAAELSNAFAKGATLIELDADITLTGAWTPVGNAENPWYGVFDGKNHKISGLSVEGVEYAAFISHTAENTTVKNLTLENVNLNSTKHAAGVVCVAGAGLTLENIKVSGTIVAASYAGGIVHNAANATIKNCENNTTVTANRAGGIASWVTAGANIENVVNKGNITGGVGASGIAHGFAGSIKNAKNYGTIISNNVEAAAGIAGVQKAASTYEYCYNYGKVTSTFDDPNASAAGILGQSAGSASTLKYCANYGEIKAEKSYAAGIAYSLYGTINASYCYNNGAVNGADGAGAIAPKAQYGAGDKASYCLNAGVITSNGIVYQGSNNNVSCYYYNNGELLNVADNTVVAVDDALAVLNGGTDANFFKVENDVITVK